MPKVNESICCKEISRVVEKMDSFEDDLDCITHHPGLDRVCLDKYVLETEYYQYTAQYGGMERRNVLEHKFVSLGIYIIN